MCWCSLPFIPPISPASIDNIKCAADTLAIGLCGGNVSDVASSVIANLFCPVVVSHGFCAYERAVITNRIH